MVAQITITPLVEPKTPTTPSPLPIENIELVQSWSPCNTSYLDICNSTSISFSSEISCSRLFDTEFARDDESKKERDLRVAMLHRSSQLRQMYLKCFVKNQRNKDPSLENIAKKLSKAECWLSDVVCLQDAELTLAFLQERDAASNDERISERLIAPEVVLLKNLRLKCAFGSSAIDGDSQRSVDLVMNSLDVQNAEVILKNGFDKVERMQYFIGNIVKMATTHRDLKVLKVYVEQIVGLNLLDDQASRIIEQQVFQNASMDAVQVLIDCGVEARIEELFNRNALAAVFGNPNVNVGFLNKLEFDTNARGDKDYTALHYAVQNSLVDKVKFLLECGAEPNSINWQNETPLVLTLREPAVNSIDNKNCAELLLQHGADPFLSSWEGQSFESCIGSENSCSKYLTELALAYARVYKSAGAANLSADTANALASLDTLVRKDNDLFRFYIECKYQLRALKTDVIRGAITMFTVVSETGDKLVRILEEKDRRAISNLIEKYKKENSVNSYYINAMEEHMRQFRKLLTCQNRAMVAIAERVSERIEKPVSSRKILNKVISDFSGKDLLMFQ